MGREVSSNDVKLCWVWCFEDDDAGLLRFVWRGRVDGWGWMGWGKGGRQQGSKSHTHTHTAIYQASTLSLATTSERRIAGLPDSCDRLGEPAVSSNAQPGRRDVDGGGSDYGALQGTPSCVV